LNRAFSGSMDWNSMVSNINGNIICDIPDPRYITHLQILKGGNPVDQVLYYIIHNPKHYILLSSERLYSFFNITRPYYDPVHNIYLAISAMAIYALFIAGLKAFNKSCALPFRIFVLSLIAFYTIAITFQCDDYHSRFIMALFPSFILIGTLSIKAILKKFNAH